MALTREDLEEILEEKLNKKLNPILKSVEFMSASFDEITKKMVKLEQDKNEISMENKQLKSECLRLSNDLELLKQEMNNMEQYSRRDCLEIRGIPPTTNEDTNKIVQSIGNQIGVEVADTDISISHRLPSEHGRNQLHGDHNSTIRDPAIIVKFTRRDIRDKFYKARKNLRDKTTRDIGMLRTTERRIYIGENLTRHNRKLFNRCLQAKRELKYKFIWTSAGKVLLRRDESSPVKCIQHEDDLRKIHEAAARDK